MAVGRWSKATAGAVLVLAAVLAGACGRSTEKRAPPQGGMNQADYDAWRRPDAVVAALELGPGDIVADVGAGRGYLTGRLARAVGPTGRVVATDIDAGLLAEVDRLPSMAGAAPIETRLVPADRPGLEAGRYDLVLLAQVDHYLADRVGYLRQLRGALSQRGRIAVSNRLHHRDRLLAAAGQAGFVVETEHRAELPGQYLVVLTPTGGER